MFTGAQVEGNSGFVNLMQIKQQYFESLRTPFMERIDELAKPNTPFREELFDKLYTFFHRYFCESGSIYFRHLPAFAKIYESAYADGQDITLLWKTQMLYYVKSDVLICSMPVELPSLQSFYFDTSKFVHKKNNERREFVFTFIEVKKEKTKAIIHLNVSESKRGTKTKFDEIIKGAKKAGVSLTDEQLQKAIGIFRRQSEADYFIHKDAGSFLYEQFDLWMYQYMFNEKSVFEEERIRQLQAIKDSAYYIINFISQFEDELRRVWEKPKFVRGLNYVVTIDRLNDSVREKIIEHAGISDQIEEWQNLKLVDANFSLESLCNNKYKFLPLDTKYFKELELEILDALGNLDEVLDGELVHSENWQALNTLQKRYKEKVKFIYIDPPFNLDGSDQFDYRTNYKDSCWATMLENRILVGKEFLSEDGAIFVRCDYNGNWIVRCLLDAIFGSENFKNEVIVNRTQEFFKSPTPKQKKLMNDIDSVLIAGKSGDTRINRIRVERATEIWHQPFLPARDEKDGDPNDSIRIINAKEYKAPNGRKWGLTQDTVDEYYQKDRIRVDENGNVKYWPLWKNIKNNWTDISGYSRTSGFDTENSEELLARSIQAITEQNEYCVDFFAGSGTTQATAQKLKRKWLGVEMGEHFHTIILPRMKKVLGGKKLGISNDTDYAGGGAFKYYELEQYEEALKKAHYKDSVQVQLDSTKSPFAQYVFFGDDKLAHVVNLQKKGSLQIDIHNLYPDIDVAESLANILGKSIRKRTADMVIFTDESSEKINPETMTQEEKQHFVSLIKPYLWWGE